MLTMDKVHFIRRLYYEQGKIPTIIAETGYDRKTICKDIDMTDFNTPEPKVKDPENICPKLDNYKPLIDEWLAGDKKAPRKQSHTAKRVFHRLRREAEGFDCALTGLWHSMWLTESHSCTLITKKVIYRLSIIPEKVRRNTTVLHRKSGRLASQYALGVRNFFKYLEILGNK